MYYMVLIAGAVFLLQRGQTDRQTRLNALPHAGGYTAKKAWSNYVPRLCSRTSTERKPDSEPASQDLL